MATEMEILDLAIIFGDMDVDPMKVVTGSIS